MDNLMKSSELVMDILQHNPMARNSDNILYIKVCERINKEALNQPFWLVLAQMKEYKLPQFETVRRTRQKVQEHHPELAGTKTVERQRKINEEVFREYARGDV